MLLLTPAIALIILATGVLPAVLAVWVAFAAMLFAPGFLLWLSLPYPLVRDAPALPALWFVASFVVLTPALLVMMVFHTTVEVVLWSLVAELIVLGWLAARRDTFPGRWPRARKWALGTSLVVLGSAVFSIFVARPLFDDLGHAGLINAISSTGSFPSVNPFLGAELPLNPRLGLDSWTATLGTVAYLSDVEGLVLLQRFLPPLLLAVAASAAYLLGRTLADSERFGFAAAGAAMLGPFVAEPNVLSLFSFSYRGIQQGKFVGLIVFLPVILALFLRLYHRPRPLLMIGSAVLLFALFLVHPLIALFVPVTLGFYALVDSVLNGRWRLRPVMWVGAAVLPMLVLGVIFSVELNGFGVKLSDIGSISEVAAEREFGPIKYWKPDSSISYMDTSTEDAASAFINARLTLGDSDRLLFLNEDLMFANPRRLTTLIYIFVAAGALLLVLHQRRSRLTAFVLASSLPVVVLTFFPGTANLAAGVVTPFQVWGFVWLLPISLAVAWLCTVWVLKAHPASRLIGAFLVTLVLVETPHDGLFDLTALQGHDFNAAADELKEYDGVFLAPREVGDLVAAQAQGPRPIAYSGALVMSNAFPHSRQNEALRRLQDRDKFYERSLTLDERVEILGRHAIRYVITYSGDTASLSKAERKSRREIQAGVRSGVLPLRHVRELPGNLSLYETVAEAPRTVKIGPNAATVSARVATSFRAVYSDANGWRDIHQAYLLINTEWDPQGACYVRYNAERKLLYLRSDGGPWLKAGRPGAGSLVENSMCAIDARRSSVSGSGGKLEVKFHIRFRPRFAGTHDLFLRALDGSGLWSGKNKMGSLHITARE